MKSTAPAAAASTAQTQSAKKKGTDAPALQAADLNNDLFLSHKGKKLRNLTKKLDKILEQEKLVKKGEIAINDDMKAKFATKSELKAQIKELTELCNLYTESNPDFGKKSLAESLRYVSQVLTLSALLSQDDTCTSATEEEVVAVRALAATVAAQDFQSSDDPEMVAKFSALSANSDEKVCEGGASFADVAKLLNAQFSDSKERAQTIRRINKKAKADAKEAKKAAAAAAAPADDDVQDQTAGNDVEVADGNVKADEAEDVKQDDGEAQVVEPSGEGGPKEDTPKDVEPKDGATQEVQEDGENRRGRGGRGRGRGGDRRGRGDRGGRGGQRKPFDPDDDFIEETGNRNKNRNRGGRGGRGRDYERRGRGGPRDRRGGRPQTAQPDQTGDAPAPAAAAAAPTEQQD